MFEPAGYTIRESNRAKHVRLQVSATDGVVVVVPAGFDHAAVAAIVKYRGAWIEKHIKRLQQQRQSVPALSEFPPKKLDLLGTGQVWHINYKPQSQSFRSYSLAEGELLIEGQASTEKLKAFFRTWLKQQAQRQLEPKLAELSRLARLTYKSAQFRCQKTRWGSCSARGTLNLNCKLLFLPRQTARYVLIHELSHLKHLNHSRDFWHLVARFEPDYRNLDKSLNEAWRYVPEWL